MYIFLKKTQHIFFYKSKIDKIISFVSNEGFILDAGCGSGILLFLLKNSRNLKLFGIDIRKDCIDFCSKICKNKNFYCADLRNFSLNRKFNTIICSDVIEHFCPKDQKKVMDNLNHHIENNGLLILIFPSKLFIKVIERIWKKIRKLIYPKIIFDDEGIHILVNEKKLYRYLKDNGYVIKRHGYCSYYLTRYFVFSKVF